MVDTARLEVGNSYTIRGYERVYQYSHSVVMLGHLRYVFLRVNSKGQEKILRLSGHYVKNNISEVINNA
ncbi:hypothetical protein NIES4106_61780 (plasmid) [Fischerella sp. NIES-4106]|nr:hypothetical protein NIES4106_61780 [Fischerella sp. NIES-4106]